MIRYIQIYGGISTYPEYWTVISVDSLLYFFIALAVLPLLSKIFLCNLHLFKGWSLLALHLGILQGSAWPVFRESTHILFQPWPTSVWRLGLFCSLCLLTLLEVVVRVVILERWSSRDVCQGLLLFKDLSLFSFFFKSFLFFLYAFKLLLRRLRIVLKYFVTNDFKFTDFFPHGDHLDDREFHIQVWRCWFNE